MAHPLKAKLSSVRGDSLVICVTWSAPVTGIMQLISAAQHQSAHLTTQRQTLSALCCRLHLAMHIFTEGTKWKISPVKIKSAAFAHQRWRQRLRDGNNSRYLKSKWYTLDLFILFYPEKYKICSHSVLYQKYQSFSLLTNIINFYVFYIDK